MNGSLIENQNGGKRMKKIIVLGIMLLAGSGMHAINPVASGYKSMKNTLQDTDSVQHHPVSIGMKCNSGGTTYGKSYPTYPCINRTCNAACSKYGKGYTWTSGVEEQKNPKGEITGRTCICKYSEPKKHLNNLNQELIDSAYLGKTKKVISLLKIPGINVNAADKDNGMTPLMWAGYGGYVEIAKALLAHPGIDINAKSKKPYVYTALEWIQKYKEPEYHTPQRKTQLNKFQTIAELIITKERHTQINNLKDALNAALKQDHLMDSQKAKLLTFQKSLRDHFIDDKTLITNLNAATGGLKWPHKVNKVRNSEATKNFIKAASQFEDTLNNS